MEEKIKELDDRIAKLERDSHPVRAFVTCEECKKKIKEI